MPADTTTMIPLRERLKTFDGFLERLAQEYGMTTLDLLQHLPDGGATVVPGERMVEILHDIAEWGAVLFITEGNGVVTGVSSELPKVFHKDGYYHFFAAGGFGGHIKEDGCTRIAFIERPFQGRNSRSIHFYGGDGEPMFKVFVARELSGEMNADQQARWDNLRSRW